VLKYFPHTQNVRWTDIPPGEWAGKGELKRAAQTLKYAKENNE